MTTAQVTQEAGALLKLGAVFLASGLMTMGIGYWVRILTLRKAGLEAAGLYQSAWTLGGLYVGFIIQAMAADFFPRLTANAEDNRTCNRLVNEQARVGLLLAGPGVIATLALAPLVITLLYSAKFGAAVGVLRWICVGTVIQVAAWPMGFIIVAKGKRVIYLWAEVICAVVYASLAWLCVASFGLNGAGIAFFFYCVFHALLHYPIVHRLSGFTWSSENRQTGILFTILIGAVFGSSYVLPVIVTACLGSLMALVTGVQSVRVLCGLVAWHQIPSPMRRLIVGFGFAPSGSTL